MNLKEVKGKLVDVFSDQPLTGNGLTIFWDYNELSSEFMLSLTQEMRQFESIFVKKLPDSDKFRARIFTMQEELDFAGHPLIGLAAHLHEEYGNGETEEWNIELNKKTVRLKSSPAGQYFSASMEQGKPTFKKTLNTNEVSEIIDALNLSQTDLADIPFEVISTGLPYLIVPIKTGISKAHIQVRNFESLLNKHGAKFVYVLDINNNEGRTWDNLGKVEDIATGSAAGPAAAFLFKHKLADGNNTITLKQGRFVGRPSEIKVYIESQEEAISNIIVSGNVSKVASIQFN